MTSLSRLRRKSISPVRLLEVRTLATALGALVLAFPAGAGAEERISNFVSDVAVQRDSSVEVTEAIDVNVEHDRINHGIFRDFPTRYRTAHGGQMHIGFTFEGATLDGSPVKATTSSIDRGVRIKIGDPDQIVAIGEHRYVIHYRATREIGFFKDFDELFWNATGNGWIFPIDTAEAHIKLPAPVKFGQRASYTGAEGSTSTNAEVIQEGPGEITFRTTAPLEANEGLSVAAAFPKGVVQEPAHATGWIADYGPIIVGVLALLGLCWFYYIAWQRAGRNPRPGTVVPIFAPPDGLSAPSMRYILKMAADDRAFAAALVDMGVKGHIRMVEEDGGWLSRKKTRLDRLSSETELPAEEDAALRELCRTGESIVMEQKNHTEFSSAKSSLSTYLKDQYEGKLFKRNYGWAFAGVIIFVAALWTTAASVVAVTDSGELVRIGVVLGGLAVAAMLWGAGIETALGQLAVWLVTLGAAALAFFLGMPIITEALGSGFLLPLLPVFLAVPLVASAFLWIAAPTREGRTVLDHIAGFRQYLSVTEGERLDRMTGAPRDTPEIFEKYLPYAIALGIENRWADRFRGVLAAAQAQGQQGFLWYSGSNSPWNNPTHFTETVGSSLASTISAASVAPGSSSGSGGGGFSGGGGGGGGGGGW